MELNVREDCWNCIAGLFVSLFFMQQHVPLKLDSSSYMCICTYNRTYVHVHAELTRVCPCSASHRLQVARTHGL